MKHHSGIWSGRAHTPIPKHTRTAITIATSSQNSVSKCTRCARSCNYSSKDIDSDVFIFVCVSAYVCVYIQSCWSCKCLPFELLADLLALTFSCLAFPSVLTFPAKSTVVCPSLCLPGFDYFQSFYIFRFLSSQSFCLYTLYLYIYILYTSILL